MAAPLLAGRVPGSRAMAHLRMQLTVSYMVKLIVSHGLV
jgi:hypothetical protein